MEENNEVAMETMQDNLSLSEEEKLRRVKEAKGGTWDDGWRPYCLMCDFGGRMDQYPYGFRCPKCGNLIGWNLTRLQESPLNSQEPKGKGGKQPIRSNSGQSPDRR